MMKYLVASVLLLVSLQINANEAAWQALEKTALAARHLNYKGIFAYQDGHKMRSVQINHMYAHGRELTRSLVLDGQPTEIFSEDGEVVIYHGNKNKVVVAKRRGSNLFPAMLPTNMDNLRATYTATLGDEERVAGRPAVMIDLKPNDVLRYGYRIWADKEYGLLLKMALHDGQKRILQHIGFTKIEVMNMHTNKVGAPKLDANKEYVMERPLNVKHTSDWVVGNLPPGFNKIDQLRFTPPGKKRTVNQMIFSDGIASVSLFIEEIKKGHKAHRGHKNMGSTNLCANVIDGYQVTVVGEVPHKTVRQIAQSVRLQKRVPATQ